MSMTEQEINKRLYEIMGLCKCGCGQITKLYEKSNKKLRVTKGEHRPFVKGHQNRRFRKNYNDVPIEGQFKNKGYVYVLASHHPSPTQGRYVKRSRLVMERLLGRFLTSDEIVHHKNGSRDDDRPENLELTNRSKHNITHGKAERMLQAKLFSP